MRSTRPDAPLPGAGGATVHGRSVALAMEATHRSLELRLREAMNHTTLRSKPRDTYARTDALLAALSGHLAAVDEMVLPLVRRLPDGHARTLAYLETVRELERALALLKARLYGEPHAIHASWPRVWSDVRRGLLAHHRSERWLVEPLLAGLDADAHDRLVPQVYRSEVGARTHPHPLTPYAGIGTVARRLWAVTGRR